MLVLSRRTGEFITIDYDSNADEATPAIEIFAGEPIRITILSIKPSEVKIGIQASPKLCILRDNARRKHSLD